MHPLKRYLLETGKTEAVFANELSLAGRPTHSNYISQIIVGYRSPSKRFAKFLERQTGGAVKAADLLLYEGPMTAWEMVK